MNPNRKNPSPPTVAPAGPARSRRRAAATRRAFLAAALAAALLTACASDVGSIPGVTTSGAVRVLGLEPDVRECVVRTGSWFVIRGENLGDEEAWGSGEATALFPPHPPGVPAAAVQPVGPSLFVQVPAGAESGTLILDLGAVGSAEVPIAVEGDTESAMVGTICGSNPPPSD